MATSRKQQDEEALEEERLDEDEEQGDPEAEGSDEDGAGVNISIVGDQITVELQRDGTEGETLKRIGDLVDGL